MKTPGEVAHLGDRGPQLGRGLVEQRRGGARRLAREVEPHRQGDEPLLRSVVEVALHPTALGIGRLDDPLPRRADLLELGPHLGREPFVLEGHPRHRPDGLDQPGVLQLDRRVVDKQGQDVAVALEPRRRATGRRRGAGRPSGSTNPSPDGAGKAIWRAGSRSARASTGWRPPTGTPRPSSTASSATLPRARRACTAPRRIAAGMSSACTMPRMLIGVRRVLRRLVEQRVGEVPGEGEHAEQRRRDEHRPQRAAPAGTRCPPVPRQLEQRGAEDHRDEAQAGEADDVPERLRRQEADRVVADRPARLSGPTTRATTLMPIAKAYTNPTRRRSKPVHEPARGIRQDQVDEHGRPQLPEDVRRELDQDARFDRQVAERPDLLERHPQQDDLPQLARRLAKHQHDDGEDPEPPR